MAAGRNYYQTNDETLVARDRSTTIVQLVLAGDFDEATANVARVLDVIAKADEEDDFRVLMSGAASIAFETNELSRHDLEQGERFGLPVALIILLVLFGSIVAALLPIGLAIVAIIVALGLVALIGQAFQLVFFVTMMVSMIGMAVGIDYSLLIVSRFREEMSRGLGKLEAVIRAGETAGVTVLFSGVTTVVSLCGMLIVPATFFRSLAIGAILVVMVALGATLTLLPAALALLGPGIDRLRIPFVRRRNVAGGYGASDGFWGMTTRLVTKFPIISILAVGGPMVACTLFYLQIDTGINGLDTFPEGARTKEAFFVLEEKFSFGLVNPAEIVIEGDLEQSAGAGVDRPPGELVDRRLQVSNTSAHRIRPFRGSGLDDPPTSRRAAKSHHGRGDFSAARKVHSGGIRRRLGRGIRGRGNRGYRGPLWRSGQVHADRIRVRARSQFRGIVACLSVNRGPDKGGVHEPAVYWHRLRPDGAGISERDGDGPPRDFNTPQ